LHLIFFSPSREHRLQPFGQNEGDGADGERSSLAARRAAEPLSQNEFQSSYA
jgi:hypothetical protein